MAVADLPVLSRGNGSLVTTEDGRTLVDLTIGFGSVFLGHSHPSVTRRLQEQAGRLLSCARLPTEGARRVERLLERWLPAGLRSAGLYNTGMEVAEFASRVAATHTGRNEFAGFARGMHGKSTLTAALCWANAAVRPQGAHVLPFLPEADEDGILEAVEKLLRTRPVAALYVEPIQGSNAAHEPSLDFYRRVIDLCRERGTLCIFDETLTGLHRTGPTFYLEMLDRLPDMLMFAKSLGNGFPVASLAAREGIAVRSAALPGSTFSGNPMALAAVAGTLEALGARRMAERVAAIEATIRAVLGPLEGSGIVLRGRGALWCLDFDDHARMQAAFAAIRDAGLLVTTGDRFIRLLPSATIEPHLLRDACERIAAACAGVPATRVTT